MTADYSPDAIRGVFDQLAKLAPELKLKLGGILGDAQHYAEGGYHVPRASIRGWDYSVNVMADDQLGDAHAASALDITPANEHGQALLTSRLLAATAARDPRLKPVREFFGSINGTSVVGRDVHTLRPVTADSSHTWHVHISILRRYNNDADALSGLAPLLAGVPYQEGLDMDEATLRRIIREEISKGVPMTGARDWDGKPDHNHYLETYLVGIPGYRTIADRLKAAAAAKKTAAKPKTTP